MDFFYTEIENSGPATARIGIKGHAPLSQFLNFSFILQFRETFNNEKNIVKSMCYVKISLVCLQSDRLFQK